jgi:hypothetical protein
LVPFIPLIRQNELKCILVYHSFKDNIRKKKKDGLFDIGTPSLTVRGERRPGIFGVLFRGALGEDFAGRLVLPSARPGAAKRRMGVQMWRLPWGREV